MSNRVNVVSTLHIQSLLLCFVSFAAIGQSPPDTVILNEVVVTGYLSRQPLLQTPASVSLINAQQLSYSPGTSLVPTLNTVPGVRMEERSPGSYRLSIRGSLLRSPFGVRNVKVYLDDLPLTDASGNTYLNLIESKAIKNIEILKGPDGSLFGANSGGVVLMRTIESNDSTHNSVGATGGSFGLFHENLSLSKKGKKTSLTFNQSYQRSDGYRKNSALERHFLQGSGGLNYGSSNTIKLMMLYSNLFYLTPGGLTKEQYDEDPSQARPAAGPNPGAVEQQAGIYNKTFFGGITNEFQLTPALRHVISVFGSHTDYKNPFITNYEIRQENNLGLRSYLEFINASNSNVHFTWNLGLEGQKGFQDIANYENKGGSKGTLMGQDEFHIDQIFYFTRAVLRAGSRFTAEAAISLNQYQYSFTGTSGDGDKKLKDFWMPRFAASYLITSSLAIRATVSRGYSPPAIAEVRSSNAIVNESLGPESGWNKEAGIRFSSAGGRVEIDASVFRYDLNDAIVRRVDAADQEYFVNAGGTNQTGIESSIQIWIIPLKNSGVVQGLQCMGSLTLNRFLFDQYQDAQNDYSGNELTGVPKNVVVLAARIELPQRITFFVQSNLTGRLPLNDGNTEYADSYALLQSKLSWLKPLRKRFALKVYAGVDNLLNEKYSLGNDINAFGGRYFNAATVRNYYGGISLGF